MPKTDADPVSSRLDAIIRLMLERQRGEDKTITVGDQIVTLESAGLQGKDVARILGVDVGQLPSYRRSAKKRRAAEEGEQEPERQSAPAEEQSAPKERDQMKEEAIAT
jgi:hypothetical protein